MNEANITKEQYFIALVLSRCYNIIYKQHVKGFIHAI